MLEKPYLRPYHFSTFHRVRNDIRQYCVLFTQVYGTLPVYRNNIPIVVADEGTDSDDVEPEGLGVSYRSCNILLIAMAVAIGWAEVICVLITEESKTLACTSLVGLANSYTTSGSTV